MNKKDIDSYNQIKNKTLSSSDVIKSSFTTVFNNLNKDDFVLA